MSRDERFDVIVIGAGQAGLAAAWHLAQRGLRYVALEAADQLGSSWRGRWDSLRLFSPAQYDALPGMAFPAPADTYPGKEAVANFLRAYATRFSLPVQLSKRVTELSRIGGRFLVLDRGGVPEPNLAWKDTVLVRAGEVVHILFDVTNPGRWMAHCHIAEHIESRMMFSFDVQETAAARETTP